MNERSLENSRDESDGKRNGRTYSDRRFPEDKRDIFGTISISICLCTDSC
jgi:hypothetical protein